MLAELSGEVDRAVLTVAPSLPEGQRWAGPELSGWTDERVIGQPVVFEPDFARALDLVQEGAATTLVTGSFHTVGDALAALPGFAPVG
jgi:dihydrofolate synthase/folylpolyglutamate synthase